MSFSSPPLAPPPRDRRPPPAPAIDPLADPSEDQRTRRRDLIAGGTALLIACLTHFVLFWFTPDDFFGVAALLDPPKPGERQISVTFDPIPERDPANAEYVETNPDKPSNKPDETDNESDRDQQSAQETDEGEIDPENRPRNEEGDRDSNKIVEGELAQDPIPFELPVGADGAPEGELEVLIFEGGPLPAPVAPEFLSPNPEVEGQGSFLRPDPNPAEQMDRDPNNQVILNEEVAPPSDQSLEPGLVVLPVVQGQDQNTPRPRPRVQSQVLPGPLQENLFRAEDVGIVGKDAWHSDMGEYMAEVLGIIGNQWHNTVRETIRTSTSSAGVVQVEFWINSEGEVEQATVLQSTAPQVGTLLARDAVVARAPYRAWTEDMKIKLGERQPVRIRFHYR